MQDANRRPIIIVMGVAGAGKSTIAARLAEVLECLLLEGDTLHPPANIEKMHAGIALTDVDRMPWLAAIAAVVDRWRASGQAGVVTCSALKRAYRDMIVGERPDMVLVHLTAPDEVIRQRIMARRGHFMPSGLLDSQLASLEPPTPAENAIVVDVTGPPDEIVAEIVSLLRDRPTTAST